MNEWSEWGWSAALEAQWPPQERHGRRAARVLGGAREHFRVHLPERGECWAVPSGGLRRDTAEAADWPVVGDWVVLREGHGDGPAPIERVLARQSRLARRAPADRGGTQVLAANVDTAFVVASLNHDWNPRRIERYLTMIHEGGVRPVLLLSKADLVDGAAALAGHVSRAAALAPDLPVFALSALGGTGLEALARWLRPGTTAVLLGSSGVGKSTLLNALLGGPVQAVRAIREGDDRGRHTTTARELFRLPGGALLADTPGLRELAPEESGTALAGIFAEVEALAAGCRFRDCRHESEPGCAVRAAAETGVLAPERLAGYGKLRREAAFRAAEEDPAEARRRKARHKSLARRVREVVKRKGR